MRRPCRWGGVGKWRFQEWVGCYAGSKPSLWLFRSTQLSPKLSPFAKIGIDPLGLLLPYLREGENVSLSHGRAAGAPILVLDTAQAEPPIPSQLRIALCQIASEEWSYAVL